MEYTFVKPIDTKTGIVYDWCLKISDIETLFMYEHRVTANKVKEVFRESLIPLGQKENKHQSIENMIICLKHERGEDNKSWVECCSDFFDIAGKGRLKVLEDRGAIYIQKSGGFFPHSSTLKIIEEKVCSDIVFPESKDVRYIKWPNGTHWYVKVSNIDVKVDGKMKWDSKAEAEEAYKKFVKTV